MNFDAVDLLVLIFVLLPLAGLIVGLTLLVRVLRRGSPTHRSGGGGSSTSPAPRFPDSDLHVGLPSSVLLHGVLTGPSSPVASSEVQTDTERTFSGSEASAESSVGSSSEGSSGGSSSE